MTGASLEDSLREHGLYVRGVTRLTDAEIETYGLDPQKRQLALVGNRGSSYWPAFSEAPEFDDGAPDPLDRWSKRIAEAIAARLSLATFYPSDGPPYLPFQQWANRAEALRQSPVGVMMHPELGLWHSYRFAVAGVDLGLQPAAITDASPCLDCEQKPCLHTCPVDAFDGSGYAVERCADYLRETPDADCHRRGCMARHACPVAPEFRYIDAQGAFHLRAFLQARPG